MLRQWKIRPSEEFIDAVESYCIDNNLKLDSRRLILIMAVGLETLTGQRVEQPLRKRGGNHQKFKKKVEG